MNQRVKKTDFIHRTGIVLVMLVLVLTACNMPSAAFSGNSPRAWIDKPLDGAILPLGPVEVISHGADQEGVVEMALFVNGEQVRVDAATQGGRLQTFSQIWEPEVEGRYTLAVIARTGTGRDYQSLPVEVHIGEDSLSEDQPQEDADVTAPTITPEPPTPTASPSVAESCTDRIDLAGDTIMDGTVFLPGSGFTQTWTLVNAGTCTWSTKYSLTHYGGAKMGSPDAVSLPEPVEPGDTLSISLNLTAPDQPGEYLGTWMMKNQEGETFGLGDNAEYALWVNIVVPSPTATPSPPAPVAHAAPSNLQITSSVCDGSGLSVTLSWADNSDNEDGFRLYRDGGLVDTLGANSTSYNSNAPHKNSAYTFEVEAFNGVGSSSKVSVNSQICPVP